MTFADLNDSQPMVSIGLPVYNGQKHVRQAIQSLLAQEYRRFELIVSDNASTDGTWDILTRLADGDARLRLIRQSRNIGAHENFRTVLQAAHHDLFMWAAHDDLWEPAFIGEMVSLLKQNPDAVMAFCSIDNVADDGTSVLRYDFQDLAAKPVYDRLATYLMRPEISGKANPYYGLIRRPAIMQVMELYHSPVQGSSDMLMLMDLLGHGRFVFSDRILFHKRMLPAIDKPRPDPWRKILRSLTRLTDPQDDFRDYLLAAKAICQKTPGLNDAQRQQLVALARKRLAAHDRRWVIRSPLSLKNWSLLLKRG